MKIDSKVPWIADGYRTKLFEDETLKQAAIRPSEKDNFILTSQDDPKSFIEYDVGGQTKEPIARPKVTTQRRVKSASSVRLQDRPWRQPSKPNYPAGFVPRSRPASAVQCKTRSLVPNPPERRIKSAGSVRTVTERRAWEQVNELRKGFYLVNKLYENDYKSSNISLHPASPAPDYRYFDRHARCYNHTHAHKQLLQSRPQPACERYLEVCGSRALSPARPDDPNVQPQRYIDYHRPRTAPATRSELQYVPRPSYVYRGHTPHFCNFVQQIPLHSKTSNGTNISRLPQPHMDDTGDFVLESVEGRLISKYRKNSIARISGTEGRPGSPSSLDGDSNHGDENRQHVTEVRVSSPSKSEVSVRSTTPVKKESPGTKSSEEPKRSPSRSSNHSTIVEENCANKGDNAWGDNTGEGEPVAIPSPTDIDYRPPSPSEPPPSPEPEKKLPVTPPKSKTKRACLEKKTKKPIDRKRNMKPIEEPKESPPSPIEEPPPVEEPELVVNDGADITVEIKVPDLPSNLDKKKEAKKEKAKPRRNFIEVEDDLYKFDNSDILNEQMRQTRAEIDWSTMENNGAEDNKRQTQVKSWIQGRLALSQQSSRFELPMDMKKLENMTPQEYIKKYCIITSRRQNLYQKIFLKNKDKSHVILFKDLDRSLKDVLVNTIDTTQIQDILKALEVDENTKIDYKLFAGMAAYAERVLYPKFVTAEYVEQLIELEQVYGVLGTEDTHDMPEYQREKIECADFCALDWKVHGVNISPEMYHVLKQIC